MFLKNFYKRTVYFSNGYPLVSGLIAVENDSEMLLAEAILNDSAPMAE